MPLFSEFVLTPDVFDCACYSNDEAGEVYCKLLKKALLEEGGLVRDLRNQGWSSLFSQQTRLWHPKWKELAKKLKKLNRLTAFPPLAAAEPACDDDWCAEAINSDARTPLTGIIVNRDVATRFTTIPKVASITDLESKVWWMSRSTSLRLRRTLPEYQDALGLVLRHSRSVMFIDAHLDPSDSAYGEFALLLQIAAGRAPAPVIEVHRVIYRGLSRDIIEPVKWEALFRDHLAPKLRASGPVVEVFIWDDFHERYIISELGGIHLGNGLKTTTNPALTLWSKISRDDRDDLQREFDPQSGRHSLRHRFKIP